MPLAERSAGDDFASSEVKLEYTLCFVNEAIRDTFNAETYGAHTSANVRVVMNAGWTWVPDEM